MESADTKGAAMFTPTRTVPEPLTWESRESYNARTGQALNPDDWYELVVATVIRHDGAVTV